MSNNLLDFSLYENSSSKFTAELAQRGGVIIFSNSGKGGDKKYFTLGLDSFLAILIDIKSNIQNFTGHENYVEREWRDLGSQHYTDKPANAQCTVQTKPMFATLSKIIMWANSPVLDNNNPEEKINLKLEYLETAINKLEALSNLYAPAIKIEKSSSKIINLDQALLDFKSLQIALLNLGLIFSESLITRFVSSLLTKPFVILTGLSGSGKTKLAQVFAKWICENESQYKLIPVGADWTNREPLLGYPNALEAGKYVLPENGVLSLILEAEKDENQNKPYFLILDEMNLSHVERYFADFLSAMESGEDIPLHPESKDWKDDIPAKIKLPKNLFIVGTVNIDETTYMFSPKVLDRANVIEFRVSESEMEQFLKNIQPLNLASINGLGAKMAASFVELAKNKDLKPTYIDNLNTALIGFFNELKKTGAEFGYRSASEIHRFVAVANQLEPDWEMEEIIDCAIMQKLLPKVHGSRRKLEPVLKTLGSLCLTDGKTIEEIFNRKADIDFNDPAVSKYPLSLEKIDRMYKGLIDNGFTSYAEA